MLVRQKPLKCPVLWSGLSINHYIGLVRQTATQVWDKVADGNQDNRWSVGVVVVGCEIPLKSNYKSNDHYHSRRQQELPFLS